MRRVGVLGSAVLAMGALLALAPPARAADPDTRLTLTNHGNLPAVVRLVLFDGATGAPTSRFACLPSAATATLRASEIAAGVTGYAVAFEVDPGSGCQQGTVQNLLTGQAHVRLAGGYQGTLDAVGVQAVSGSACTAADPTVILNPDGVTYRFAPQALTLSSLPSPADVDTLLVVSRLGTFTDGTPRPLGTLAGFVFDDVGAAHAWTVTGEGPQLRAVLSDTFPPTEPPLGALIPSGRTGSASAESEFLFANRGLLAAAFFLEGGRKRSAGLASPPGPGPMPGAP